MVAKRRDSDSEIFNRAIPGMSLTTEPGNRPWENPPMYSTVAEATEYYTERLTEKVVSSAIAAALDKGIPVNSATQLITTSSVMNGVHSIDIGVLVGPVVRELVMLAGDTHNIDYAMSFGEDESEMEVSYRLAKQLTKDIVDSMDFPGDIRSAQPEEDMDMPMEEPKGLMARRRIA